MNTIAHIKGKYWLINPLSIFIRVLLFSKAREVLILKKSIYLNKYRLILHVLYRILIRTIIYIILILILLNVFVVLSFVKTTFEIVEFYFFFILLLLIRLIYTFFLIREHEDRIAKCNHRVKNIEKKLSGISRAKRMSLLCSSLILENQFVCSESAFINVKIFEKMQNDIVDPSIKNTISNIIQFYEKTFFPYNETTSKVILLNPTVSINLERVFVDLLQRIHSICDSKCS